MGAIGAFPVSMLIVALGMSLGGTTGYAINPARDLAPRIAHAVLPIKGKGSSDWAYSWVPSWDRSSADSSPRHSIVSSTATDATAMKRIKYLIAGYAPCSPRHPMPSSSTSAERSRTCTCGEAFRSPTAVYWQPI